MANSFIVDDSAAITTDTLAADMLTGAASGACTIAELETLAMTLRAHSKMASRLVQRARKRADTGA